MIQQKQFDHSECEQLIELLPLKPQSKHRGLLGNQSAVYATFGAYSYGNHYGVTKLTRRFPVFTKYLTKYFAHHDTQGSCSSSMVVNINGRCPLHRDNHNAAHHENRLVGLGKYKGGELWIETPGNQGIKGVTREVAPGSTPICGRVQATRHQLVKFLPKLWHGPEPWEGTRISVTRGHKHLLPSDRDFLHSLGFDLPPKSPTKEENLRL